MISEQKQLHEYQEAQAIAQEIERQLDAALELRTIDGILRYYGRQV